MNSVAAGTDRIVKARAYVLSVPLVASYNLSFVSLDSFETVLVEIETESGRIRYGESCPLPGYTGETVDGVWSLVSRVVPFLPGMTLDSAESHVAEMVTGTRGYERVALTTPLESLRLDDSREVSVPLIGVVT